MDPILKIERVVVDSQREEVFPVQEKETSSIASSSDRPTMLVLSEMLEISTTRFAGTVFIP